MRRTLAVAGLVISVILSPGTAHAGGAPLPPDVKRYVKAGERVRATTTVQFRHRSELRDWVAQGPYYSYMSAGWEKQPPMARPVAARARLLGPIELGTPKRKASGWWSLRLRAPFVLQGVAPGRYRLDVCTSLCTRTSEHLLVGRFRAVAGPEEKRLRKAIDNLEAEMILMGHSVERMSSEVNVLRPVLTRVSSFTTERIADQDARIDELATMLEDVRRVAANKPFPAAVAGLAFLAGALAAGAAVLSVRSLENRRMSRKEPPRARVRRSRRSSRSPGPAPRIRRAPPAAPPMSAARAPRARPTAESSSPDRRSCTPP